MKMSEATQVQPPHVIAWNRLLDGKQHTVKNHETRTLYISPANQKHNNHYYDVMDEKLEDSTRIYFQNANGLRIDTEGGDFGELCHTTMEIQADVICIAEHNLDTTKYHITSNMEYQRQQICGPRSRLASSSSTTQMSGNYKPGGTLMIARGNIMSRFLTSGSDPLGRWTYQTFSGKHNHPITIITAYQVCQKSTRVQGQYTAHSQQESMLRQQGLVDYSPRKAF